MCIQSFMVDLYIFNHIWLLYNFSIIFDCSKLLAQFQLMVSIVIMHNHERKQKNKTVLK